MYRLILLFASILLVVLFLGILSPNTFTYTDLHIFWTASYSQMSLSFIILFSVFLGFVLGAVIVGALYLESLHAKARMVEHNARLVDEMQRLRQINLDKYSINNSAD